MFRNTAIFLVVISAVLIPLIFITNEIISLATLVALFIIAQIALLYFFYKEKEARLEHWYAFWIAVLSLGYMLLLVIIGRGLLTEFIGLLLFLIYFIGLLILLFKGRLHFKPKTKRKPTPKEEPENEDVKAFRKKDELQELVDFFEPAHKSDMRIVDVPEPKIEKIFYDQIDEDELETEEEPLEYKETKPVKSAAEKREEEKEWREIQAELPRSIVFDYRAENAPEEPEVKEPKRAAKIDFEKVKKDLEKIDDGVKTISEKIKLISEKAILEGAERKLRELQRKQQPKPKKKELKVFASKTGNKFHYNRNCLALKRVKAKDMINYTNSNDARKKGLKTCGMCK
jgi:hypothetical protein